jgi:hypothetical protein
VNTKSKIVIAAVAGAALGAAAVQGLHAQAKPKAYLITESQPLDPAAVAEYLPKVREAPNLRVVASSSSAPQSKSLQL